MKPTKNRVFCNGCGRAKMLFETEKKADNFIAFNQGEIEMETGVAPKRSYFCLFCGGWHVTSMKEKNGITRREKLFEDYLEAKKAKKQEKANEVRMAEEAKKAKKQEKVNEVRMAEKVEKAEKQKKANEVRMAEKVEREWELWFEKKGYNK
ncbi:MAG: hypothetical protein IPL33_21185 [Sphingobacteriales bacterium]|nr:hypothetical protein [Sphingobacteriales bacterium]MCC7224678.1 hypothetical protein [Chitinophagales bacterium]